MFFLSNLSYLIALFIPFFGITIYGMGLPTLSFVLIDILLFLNILYDQHKTIKLNFNIIIIFSFFLIILISTFFSYNHILSFKELLSFIAILFFIIFYNYKHLKINIFFKILTFSFFVRSIIELVYSFTHINEWLGLYKHFMRFSVAHLGGDPNNLALLLIAPITYTLLVEKNKLMRLFFLPVFLLHFTMLYSRGAILSLFLSLFFFLFYFKKEKLLFWQIMISSLVVGVIFFMWNKGYIHFSSDSLVGNDSSAQTRLFFWKEALFNLNWKTILIGNGPRTFLEIYGHWLHNSYLNRFVELGIFGYLNYLIILFFSWYVFLKQKNYIIIIFTSFLIGSFFVDFYLNGLMWFIIGYALKNSIYYTRIEDDILTPRKLDKDGV